MKKVSYTDICTCLLKIMSLCFEIRNILEEELKNEEKSEQKVEQ